MSCLHHCRIGTRCGCCLTSPPLAVHPYISEETKVLNLCNGMQLGCAPGSTLTSIIMVPASLPGILMVMSVNDLRPIVWICVSIQPLRGLTLSIGALRHFTMNCKARKPVVRTFLLRP